ncbi:hypothetical protein HOD24_04315 [Candidatus Peregrinibacteria bacterium]|nr:hypothetical protein [Candidatus Peregrinibacteria bacterium]
MSEMLHLFARAIMAYRKEGIEEDRIRFLYIDHFFRLLRCISSNLIWQETIIHCVDTGIVDADFELSGKYGRGKSPAEPTHRIEYLLKRNVLTLVCKLETGLHIELVIDYSIQERPAFCLSIEDTSVKPNVANVVHAAEIIQHEKVWSCEKLSKDAQMTPSQIREQFCAI